MPFEPNAIVGPYTIVQQLGKGGMATVYKAYHEQLDRYVAIKTMLAGLQADPNFAARFRREAQLIARLDHPHIVPVYDYNEHEGTPYIVMKFIEGESLDERLRREALSLDQVMRVMMAISSALNYAHKHEVLHRDVKPSNIMLNAEGTPYLSDFGLARVTSGGESSLSAGVILGTPQYMAPEQALGESELDARADVYALGVVLYELLVGHVPFSGSTPYAIIHNVIYTEPPPPTELNPELPPQVELVLLTALGKERDDRYPTAVDMVKAFRQAVADTGLKNLNPERAKVAEASFVRLREQLAPTTRKVPPTRATQTQPPPPQKPAARGQAADDADKTRGHSLIKALAPKPEAQPPVAKKASGPIHQKILGRGRPMSELYDQIVSQRGGLEKLIANIPGFRGYIDKESRRSADRMLRDFIAEQLSLRINRFASLESRLVDSGGLAFMSRSAAVKAKVQTFRDRVKAAAPGYSGFFAAVKIDTAELEKLYSFDEAQVRYLDRFDEGIAKLEAGLSDKAAVEAALNDIETVATEAGEAFSLREEVLTNLDKSL